MGDERGVLVWDLPVRLFHWLTVLLLALLWYTGKVGGLDLDLPLPSGRSLFLASTELHMLLGQVLLGLVIFRLLWGLFGSSTARFASFVRGPRAVLEYLGMMLRGRLPLATSHNPAGAVMVLLLLGLLAAQAVTGLFASDDIFSEGPLAHLVSTDTSASLTGLHAALFDLLLAAAGFHVLAVLYYLVRGKNLIGAMLSGRKRPELISPDDHSEIRIVPMGRAVLLAVVSGLAVWALRLL